MIAIAWFAYVYCYKGAEVNRNRSISHRMNRTGVRQLMRRKLQQ